MKSLFYALVLLAVLVGSVVLLRSLEPPASRVVSPPERGAIERAPAVESEPLQRETAGGGGAEPSPADLASAERLLATWHPREATRLFERVVEADSMGLRARVGLIRCYAHPLVCREDDARAAWQAARDSLPADSSFLDGLRALVIDRDYAAAVDDFREAAGHGASAGLDLARAYYHAGQLGDARKVLDGLPRDEGSAGRAVELGVRIRVAAGDLDGADGLARELAGAHAAEPFPYVLLAQVELLRGDPVAAKEFCNNALAIDPRYVPAILFRAALYAAGGQHAAARVGYEKLLLFDDPVLQGMGEEGIAFTDFLSGDFSNGTKAMDEAIRHAVAAGAVRRGLSYAVSMVSMMCELGRAQDAGDVVGDWVTGFGDIPEHLARLRILILQGDLDSARQLLEQTTADGEWMKWARVLSLDVTELTALIHIAAGEPEAAMKLLDDAGTAVAAGASARRTFVRGYAAFEAGDAEAARKAFASVPTQLYSVEFPYHGDPVLAVQSRFFLAEAALAAGAENEAREAYRAFLDRWGAASWDLPAVARAREKLTSLEAPPAGP